MWEIKGLSFEKLVLIKVIITIVLSILSYYLIEKPFLYGKFIRKVPTNKIFIFFVLVMTSIFALNNSNIILKLKKNKLRSVKLTQTGYNYPKRIPHIIYRSHEPEYDELPDEAKKYLN